MMWTLAKTCVCISLLGALLRGSGASDAGKISTEEEWEAMFREKANEHMHRRTARDVTSDMEVEIQDVQQYYRQVFKTFDDITAIQGHGQGQEDQEVRVPGRYLVLLKEDASDDKLDHLISILQSVNAENNGRIAARDIEPLRHIGKGFTASLGNTAVEALKKHPHVLVLEQDIVARSHTDTSADAASADTIPWNLDRIDQRSSELDSTYQPKGTGEGVDVYILDTGIRYTHDDFEGRAHYGEYDAMDALVGTNKRGIDVNGHGTHCAGTIGGKKYGVAKKANLYSVRVLEETGVGSVSCAVRALEHIAANRLNGRSANTKAILSLSLGVTKSEAFNTAIDNVVKQGGLLVSAAGNQARDSCHYSPASASLSIAVAASDEHDESASFSNLGACVDVFAPGSNIVSDSFVCDRCTSFKSGTSMACPHVAGYAAVILGLNPGISPSEIKELLSTQSTQNSITINYRDQTLTKRTPNNLLYVGSNE